MRVGVFLDRYIPEDGGGFTFQGEVFRALVEMAAESHHEFVAITSHPKQLADSGLETLAYRKPGLLEKPIAFIARNWPNFRHTLKWSSSFEKRLRRAGIEFVWFLGPRPKDIDLPYMTIVLDLQHRLQPWFPEVSRYGEWDNRERGFARFLRRAAAIIAGTQAGKQEIIDFYQVPAERIHILPHPTPDAALHASEQPHPETLARFDLPDAYLFYPAQFWPHKNHVNLLLAMKTLKDEGLRIPLVLAGSDFGNQAFVRQKITELDLEEQVHLVGFVTPEELNALYRRALALVYVSFFGPENLPPLEAFALGCPVIAARVSGAEEQMGDVALLVDPANVEEIAAAIRSLHGDSKLRARLIARGRKRAVSWTTNDFVKGVFKIMDGFEPVRKVWRD